MYTPHKPVSEFKCIYRIHHYLATSNDNETEIMNIVICSYLWMGSTLFTGTRPGGLNRCVHRLDWKALTVSAVGHYLTPLVSIAGCNETERLRFSPHSSNWIKLAGLDLCNSCPTRQLWPVTEEEEEEEEEGFKSCI